MNSREPSVETFLRDVSAHQMTVKHSDGLYRHLRFQSVHHSWNMWFDLVTWPGFLTICGDMGTWTFARLPDMFTFFRSGEELRINASYWAEKLQHGTYGGRDGAKVYDEEVFKSRLLEQLSGYYGYEGDELAEVTAALKDDVLYLDGYDLKLAARDFTHRFSDGREFQYDSCELPDGKVYAYHFIWCLYAIVWGIQQWDAIRDLAPAVLEAQ